MKGTAEPHDAGAGSTNNAIDGETSAETIIQAGRIGAVHLHRAPAARRQPIVIGEIPREPASFQPRDDLRRQLAAVLDGAGDRVAVVCAVTGTRGVGKTHLAADYARRCIAAGWPVVAWIVAEGPGQLVAGLDQLARAAGLRGPGDDSATAARKARHWLETSAGDRSLVVFDNALDADELARWLPAAGRVRVIVTSTQRSFEELATPVDVGVFSPEEARTFLRRRTGLDDGAGAWAVAEEVGYLPLALGQAAALIRRQHISYPTFLTRLRAFPVEHYLTRHAGDGYPRGAAQAVLVSLQDVEDEEPLARPLVDLLSVLSPGGVRRVLLPPAAGGASAAGVDAALGRLAEASMITFSTDDQSVIMHRFTQRVLRDRLVHAGDLRRTLSLAGAALKDVEVSSDRAWRERGMADHLVQQVDAVWEHAMASLPAEPGEEFAALVEALAGTRYWTARHLREIGDLTHAIHVGMVTLRATEDVLEPDNTLIPVIRNELGLSCRQAGRLPEAIALFEENLAVRRRLLGDSHPQTLNSRENLANALRESGRFDAAIELVERNLADRERILGPDHVDTQGSRTDLAFALREAGRLDRAIELFARNLVAREASLGPDHPRTLISRSNLGSAYQRAGRLTDAIGLLEQTVAGRERTLGAEHPTTLRSRTALADAYRAAGRVDEAIVLLERTVTDLERVLGPDHPYAISGRDRLGTAYRAAGRLDEAMELLERAVADRERVLGPRHPKTLGSRTRLATAYAAAGRTAEAVELLDGVLADGERILGGNHPVTGRARTHLDAIRRDAPPPRTGP